MRAGYEEIVECHHRRREGLEIARTVVFSFCLQRLVFSSKLKMAKRAVDLHVCAEILLVWTGIFVQMKMKMAKKFAYLFEMGLTHSDAVRVFRVTLPPGGCNIRRCNRRVSTGVKTCSAT
jgi:hypothetical protein